MPRVPPPGRRRRHDPDVPDPVAVAVPVEIARPVDHEALPGPDLAADRHHLDQLPWRDLGFMRYKNPFGDASDGRWDAAMCARFGVGALAVGAGQ